MALQLTKQHVGKMAGQVQSLQKRIGRFKEDAEKMTEKFVRTTEIGVAALGVGILQGRTGGIEVMGIPAELGIGVGLNMLGYFGAAGKHSDHLNNLGDGALAGYLATVGRGLGAEWKAKSTGGMAPAAVTSKGEGQLSRGEVDAIVRDAVAAVRQAA